MKTTKRLLALLLALVLTLALCGAAYADGETTETGTITINNAQNGFEYKVYRIFDVATHDAATGDPAAYSAVTYTVNSAWSGFFATGAAGLTYVDIDSATGLVSWKADKNKEADVAAFAKAAKEWAATNSVAAVATTTASGATVTFSNLPLGYYLVSSSVGALCALDTTMPNATISEKNGVPDVVKEVKEDSTGNFGKANDADIGQKVEFRTKITVVAGATSYVLHDKMDAGLTFDSTSVVVKCGDTTLTANTDYTLTTSGLADGCTFEISFADSALTLPENQTSKEIEVTYSATVNSGAAIGTDGNTNETWLKYNTDNTTTHKTTETYTWELNVFKYTKNGETEKALAGAEFVLYKTVDTANHYAQLTDGKITGWTTTEAEATKLTSGADGKIAIKGLDADTYYLKETKAPAGYNPIKDPITVTVTSTADANDATKLTVSYSQNVVDYDNGKFVKVENNAGTELPSTGGIGTTIFYILGGVLVAAAVIVFVTKKRMDA